jgi:ankyrin repeat protein
MKCFQPDACASAAGFSASHERERTMTISFRMTSLALIMLAATFGCEKKWYADLPRAQQCRIAKYEAEQRQGKSGYKIPTLSIATREHDYDVVEAMIAHRFNVNEPDTSGFTSLCMACESDVNDYKMAEILVNHGADVNASSPETPLVMACVAGNARIVRLLLSHGADPNKPNNVTATPLMVASDAAIANLLIQYGANVNAHAGGIGLTPLMFHRDDIPTIQILLLHGADINAINRQSMTLLDIVKNEKAQKSYDFLRMKGALHFNELKK